MKKYRVTLTDEERQLLKALISKGKTSAIKQRRARILLKADQSPGGPGWSDKQISDALDVGKATCERVRQQFVEDGFEQTLDRRPTKRVYRRKIDGDAEAHMIAMICHQEPPEGYSRWSVRLLADRLVELKIVESTSREGVRRALKKMNLSLGSSSNGAPHPRATPNS